MKKLTEKGNIDALQAFIMGIGTIAVVLAIVLYVLTELQSSMEPDAVVGCGLNSTGGTAGDIKAVQVTITGTNYNNEVITEDLPAFTENTAGTVTGSKAFKTVTEVVIPAHTESTWVKLK